MSGTLLSSNVRGGRRRIQDKVTLVIEFHWWAGPSLPGGWARYTTCTEDYEDGLDIGGAVQSEKARLRLPEGAEATVHVWAYSMVPNYTGTRNPQYVPRHVKTITVREKQ